MIGRIVAIVSGVALVVFLIAATWLGRLERGGPAHVDVVLDGDVPATLYFPGEADGPAFLDPPARSERPPAVVFMHGFSSDRFFTSSPARRLAQAGYAVLALDVRGHGQNRNPFLRSRGRPDTFYRDLSAAVDFLRVSPFVDGSRIVVMGHSMGAGGSLDYASRDSGIDGAVMIAGGWTVQGPYRPRNALFIFAEGDPEFIKERSRAIASKLAGVEAVELGRVYGDVAKGTAVRAFEVPGTDHGRIVWNDVAIREIAAWLDAVFGLAGRAPPETADPRLRAALVLLLAVLLVLPGLGLVVGRLVPEAEPLASDRRLQGIAALAVALLATTPLLAVGNPGAILSVEVGDVMVTHLALTGIALLVVLALVRAEVAPLLRHWPRTLAAAAVGLVGAYCLMYPIGVVFHRMALTPERMLVFAASTLALLPMAFAFQVLLRRGSLPTATGFAVAGRALILLSFVAGVHFGILGGVVLLMLPMLVLAFVQAELVAASIYAVSRNLAAIAFIDATWLAFAVASGMPVRI